MNSPASKADPFAPSPSSLAYGVGKPRTDASATGTGKYVTGSNGQQYEKLQQGYRNTATGETVSGISLPSKGSNITYSGGGGGGYGGGSFGGGGGYGGGSSFSPPAAKPIEFYLGAAPTLPSLDLTGPMNQFRGYFNSLNSGVNPNFDVDGDAIAQDAVRIASRLGMSPEQIKKTISAINPTTGEIISEVEQISGRLNDPGKIAGKASAIANQLNAKYQSAFNAAMPGYGQNMAIANKLTTTYLKGQIPQDVVDQVYRGAAAKGFTAGIFGGGIGRNIVARDLGLTSLQLQTAGANLLQQTAQTASQVLQATMPVTGESFVSRFMTDPNQIFSTVANMKRVDPNTIFNAVYVKPQDVYNQLSASAQQSTLARANFEASKMISPERVFDTLVTQAQYNQQIATQNALNAWQTQPLPGQFDIAQGRYVGYKPGEFTDTKPTAPGSGQKSGGGLAAFDAIPVDPSWTPYQSRAKPGDAWQFRERENAQVLADRALWNQERAKNVFEVDRLKRDYNIQQAMQAAYG